MQGQKVVDVHVHTTRAFHGGLGWLGWDPTLFFGSVGWGHVLGRENAIDKGANMRLGNSWIRWVVGPSRSEALEDGAEPIEELAGADVPRLPAGVKEAAPGGEHEVLGVTPPHGVPEDVGDAVLEVLHMGAGFHAGDEAAHENAA